MKRFLTLLTLGLSALAASAQVMVPVDTKKFPDYRSGNFNPDPVAARFVERYRAAAAEGRHGAQVTGRPDHVNNAATLYFPPVFNQSAGSCGSASRIAYMFSHEQNSYRNTNGSLPENYYPTHFVWLLTNGNSGKDAFVTNVGVPSAKTYGGQTYSSLFGYNEETDNCFGWMTGYDKWFEAFHNRCTSPTSNVASVGTEEGMEMAKNWLWNHCGDESFHSGGLIGLGVASGGSWGKIPSTAANDEAGVSGMYYVQKWGTQVDHALTMVGYDDRIEFDLDGDGIYGEASANEKGAFIIVNSWGGWCNNGFIYCPYAYSGSAFTSDGKFNGDFWWGEFYHVRKDYRPFRTIKLKMDYSHRSELMLQAGVSTDLTATAPSSIISMDHFKYAGDGANGNTSPAPEVPMLGKWADGKMHTEPMEFGYDLTDLSAGYDRNKPLKYFFIVNRKKATNAGTGHIYEASIMDYEHDIDGVETPFDLGETGNVEITTSGKQTIISVVVYGAGYNAVNNLAYTDGEITWSDPDKSSHKVDSYNIYKEGALLASVDAKTYAYAPGEETGTTSYAVAAVYSDGQESARKSVTSTITLPEKNKTYSFSKAGFTIPEVFDNAYEQATIEFWIKPNTLASWNNAAGPGWGTWYQHCDASGYYTCGWSTSDRVTSTKSLTTGDWHLVSIVVNKNKCTVYINGAAAGTCSSSNYSGIGGFGDYVFSSSSGNNAYQQCRYDEIKIWNYARSAAQIKAGYTAATRTEYYGDVLPEGLIAYFKGDSFQGEDGIWYMLDCAGGHHAPVSTATNRTTNSTTPAYVTPAEAGTISIAEPGTIYAGQPVTLKATRNDYVNRIVWTLPDNSKTSTLTPTLNFSAPGEYTVTVTGTDYAGNEITDQRVLTVLEALPLDASFVCTKTSVAAGERVSFKPNTCVNGYSYVWSFPGAEKEIVESVSAAAAYEAFGTYTATLTVTDAAGNSARSSVDIIVQEVAPESAFTVSDAVVMKGQPIILTDKSKYAPNSWQWLLNGTGGNVVINGQSTVFTPENSGVFDISLVTRNNAGSSKATQERALVVVNADSKNGLSFSQQAAKVTTKEIPLTVTQRSYTFDWWMNPSKLADYCEGIGATDATFQIKVASDGSLCLTNKGKTAKSTAGTVEAGSWHHYAIAVNGTSVVFYKDGVKVNNATTTSGFADVPSFSIGTTSADWNGSIDEFRIWDTNLTAAKIQQYANQPIENPASVENLVLYYDFNQTGGDVQDRANRMNDGVRSGFGPDGDAWGLSKGVFCLNFENVETQDVTSTYLTNYKRSFSKTSKTVNNTTASRFYEIADWTLENTVKSGDITTGVHVDTKKNYDFTCTTGWDSFGNLENHKAFQVCELEPGIYTLHVAFGQHPAIDGVYLVANAGKTLPDAADLNSALSYVKLSDATITFVVSEKQEVALGVLVASMSGQNIFTIQKFQLTYAPLDVREPVDPSGMTVIPATAPASDAVYDLSGRRITAPQSGQLYIQSGQKRIRK